MSQQPFYKNAAVFFMIFFITAAGFANFSSISAAQADEEEEGIIIKYKPGVDRRKAGEKHAKRQSREDRRIDKIDADVIKTKRSNLQKALNEYKNDPDVLYAEQDHIAKAFIITNDTSLSSQWGMFKIEAASNSGTSAWDLSGGKGVRIAVLDTGINESHPDLAGKVVARRNLTTAGSNSDVNGHGTHVAGVIAANANNSQGIAGVAYYADLMNVKVLDDNGSGNYSWVADGIIWAADNGAKVINLSLGGANTSNTMKSAIDYAVNKGAVVVAAAGNDGSSGINYPAYYTNVIAVGATDSNDRKPSWSNYGSWVDVAAPGVAIYSTYKGGYGSLSGTSMASPHVAGLAGLVWARGECSTASCVRSKIESGADKISGTGQYWASGRINALKALGGTQSPAPAPAPAPAPSPAPAPAPAPSTVMKSAVEMWSSYYYSNYRLVYIRVKAVNSAGSPLSGSIVAMAITTPSGRSYQGTGTTGADGTVTFRLLSAEKGTFSARVGSLTRAGYLWDGLNSTGSLIIR